MAFVRRLRVPLLLALLGALAWSPIPAQQRRAHLQGGDIAVEMTGEEVRDLLLDILDDAEWTAAKMTEMDPSWVQSIQAARGTVVDIPREDLDAWAEDAAPFVQSLRRHVRKQRLLVNDLVQYNATGAVPDYVLEIQEAIGESGGYSSGALTSAGFPSLRDFGRGPGIADYPNADIAPQAGTGTSEDEYEAQEGEEESRESAQCAEGEVEDEAEESATGGECDWDGTFCSGDCPTDQNTLGGEDVDGPGAVCNTGPIGTPEFDAFRATRDGPGTILLELLLLEIDRTLAAIAGRFCDQDIAGFSCSLCCIPVDIIMGFVEATFAIVQECRDLTDGAELEMTYHNTLSTYKGVEHVHGDLDTHDTALTNHNTALSNHNVALTNHNIALSNHDTALSTHDSDIKAEIGNLQGQVTTVQETLDNETEQRRIHIDVVKVSGGLLAVFTESGQPKDVVFLEFSTSTQSNIAFVDIMPQTTVVRIEEGMYQLLSPNGVGKDLYKIVVRDDDTVNHFGQVVFHRAVNSTLASQ